jgi:hypothetical protein
MFVLFLALAVLSLIILIVGFIWLLTSRGQTTRRTGPEVGAEIMTGLGNENDEAIPLVEKSVFAGTGTKVTRDAEVSFVEIRQMIRDRQWRKALPLCWRQSVRWSGGVRRSGAVAYGERRCSVRR